jgi:multimeric flavodoxin WrbA
MKLVAVISSPHKNGTSTQLVHEVVRGAKEKGYETVEYRLNDIDLKPCQACETCKKNGVDCIQNDGLKNYWKDLHEADALIVSSPVYCGLVNGPFISYTDRHFCLLWKNGCRLHTGVKLVGCFSQGYSDLEHYMPHFKKILADFENRKMVTQGILVLSPELSVKENKKILNNAYELGKSL